MRWLFVLVELLVLLVGAASSQDIRFPVPELAPAPTPTPEPAPIGPAKLTADSLYVIDADFPILVLEGVPGLVRIGKDAGPITIRAKFVGGAGKVETRKFLGKEVYSVEAAATGRVDLIVVKVGETDAANVIRKTLDVDAGEGPRPPPDPPAPKPPEPPTPSPAPIPVPGLRALIIEESAERQKLPASQIAVMFSATIQNYLNAKCVVGPDGKQREWWILDKDTDTSRLAKHWQDAMRRPRTSLPWLIVSDGAKGFEGPLPLTVADTLAVLKKVGGE